jgi:2-oxoglutarate ferredoxin oxidoreductase subunit beta
MHATQKNDYPITVLRGHSVSEVVLDPNPVGYTGIGKPSVVLCVAGEGVARRKDIFGSLQRDTLIIKDSELVLPDTVAKVIDIDFSGLKIKNSLKALAALAALAGEGSVITKEMIMAGISHRYQGKIYDEAMAVIARF